MFLDEFAMSFVISRYKLIQFFALPLLFLTFQASAYETVNLQLKWKHQFQFAGYYAAKEKGYYRDAGLDVHIIEAEPGMDPVQMVVDGKAQYGVGSSSLLLKRQAGKPVVVLGVVFQHSPFIILTLGNKVTQNIHDLTGKRIMHEPQDEELLAYLKQEGISPKKITWVEHSHDINSLTSGDVDAVSAYITDEPYQLEHAGVPYQIYTPRSAGIDFYGDNLFTTDKELTMHPERAEAFRKASMQGWKYAMAHPEEIADLIIAEYAPNLSKEQLLYEARQMKELIKPDFVEIGYMHPGRWQYIADTYIDLGMLPHDFALSDFLYQPESVQDMTMIYRFLIPTLVLIIIITALAYRFSKLSKELKASEERWKFALEGAGDGVWDWNVQTDEVIISARYKEMYGFTDEDVSSNSQAWKERIHPDDRESVEGSVQACLNGETTHYVNEHRVRCKDGSIKWALARGMIVSRDSDGKPLRMIGTHADITDRKIAEEQFQHLAHYDVLTDLPNRTLIGDRLKQALAYAKREKVLLALMFIDLDKFKPVNDTLGHEIGDLLLKQVARRLQQSVRGSDTVARIGGDEFVVLLPVIDNNHDAAVVAEKILQALNKPFEVAQHSLNISSSIGIAVYPQHGTDEKLLLINADIAMYHAKKDGRNNAQFYRQGMEKTEHAGS